MDILSLAIKDIMRRKGKSIYMLIAVVMPVAILSTIISTISNADTSLSNLASKFGFTIMIQPKSISTDRIDQLGVVVDEYISEASIISVKEIIMRILQTDKDPIIMAPRLYIKTEINSKNSRTTSILAGIDFKAELDARPSWNLIEGRWPERDYEAVAGRALARVLKLSSGDYVTINNKGFNIVGIFKEHNSPEDHMVFAFLGTAQQIFGKKGLVSVINLQNVSLDRDERLLRLTIEELNRGIPNIKALSPQQFSTMKYIMLKKTFKFLISIVIATVIISIFSIFNIVTSSLYSRVREIGLLKSAGASWSQLFKLFLYEYLIIGLAGGMVGYSIGILMTYLLDSFLLKIGSGIRINIMLFVVTLFIGILCSLLSSFYPTYKLSKIKITETFRTQWEV